MEVKRMTKKKYRQPKQRKIWEKRDFSQLRTDRPTIFDSAGVKAAYAWGRKNKIRVHVETISGISYVWIIK